ncbi:MAG TPA: hypothetical protein VGA56_13455 [Opitutaceae bacterium]
MQYRRSSHRHTGLRMYFEGTAWPLIGLNGASAREVIDSPGGTLSLTFAVDNEGVPTYYSLARPGLQCRVGASSRRRVYPAIVCPYPRGNRPDRRLPYAFA